MERFNIRVKPCNINGEISAPPSKSFAHRILISAFLSGKEISVLNVGSSVDATVTLNALKTLGASVKVFDGKVVIKRGEFPNEKVVIDCKESGSSLRFLLPVVSALGVKAEFTGAKRLLERPIKELTTALNQNGADIDGLLVNGKLTSGKYYIDGGISSQYITGLLLALSYVDGESEIIVNGKLVSQPYVDITLSVLKDFGVEFTKTQNGYKIKGGYDTKKMEYTVEGDWSGASFLLSAGAIGGSVRVKGLNLSSVQGDKKIIDILKSFGAEVIENKNSVTVNAKKLSAITVDMEDVPDLVQIVSVVASYASGTTRILGVDRLRLKESDRIKAVIDGLTACSITAKYINNSIEIVGGKPTGAQINGGNDHRTVMSAVVMAGNATSDSLVLGGEAITKSYPDFVDDYIKVGGEIDVETTR